MARRRTRECVEERRGSRSRRRDAIRTLGRINPSSYTAGSAASGASRPPPRGRLGREAREEPPLSSDPGEAAYPHLRELRARPRESYAVQVSLRPGIQVGLVVLLALCIRGIFVFQLVDSPLFHGLAADSAPYEQLANRLLAGDALYEGFVYQNPLYPLFLAALQGLFGAGALAVLVVQATLDALGCALLYLIGRSTFGHRVGLIAAALMASYGILIFFTGLLLATSLVVFLLLAAVATLLSALARPRPSRFLLAGALFGLASLGRPNAVVLLGLLPIWFAVSARPALGDRRCLAGFGLLLLGAALVTAPIGLRNHAITGRWSPFPITGGLAFYIANNPDATGRLMSPPGVSAAPLEQLHSSIALAQERTGRDLTPSETSDYWRAEGLAYLREQPISSLWLYAKKARLFWSAEETPLNVHYEANRELTRISRLPWLGFGLAAPFGLLGIGLALRRGDSPLLLVLIVGGYFAASLPFVISARYRLPVVPFLLLYAAYAGVQMVELARDARKRRAASGLLAAASALAMLLAVVNLGTTTHEADRATLDNNLAWVYATSPDPRVRNPEKAIALALRACQQTGFQSAETLDTLAAAYAAAGRFEDAIAAQRSAISLRPTPAPEFEARLERYRAGAGPEP